MDKLQWFKFTPSDWMMGKIQRCPEITQARFMRLCCLYWNKDCILSIEDAEIEVDKEHFDILVSKKIVSINDNNFNISFLDEQYLEIQEDTKDKSKSGIIGNLKRWHPLIYNEFVSKKISLEQAVNISKNITEQSHPDNTPITTQSQNIAEKTREDKMREEEKYTPVAEATDKKVLEVENPTPKKQKPSAGDKEEKSSGKKEESFDWEKLLQFINLKTGRQFQVINQTVRTSFKRRLKDGYTKQQIQNSITNASKDKHHNEHNNKWLTPEYFTRAKTIDQYADVKSDSETKVLAPSMNRKN